MLKKYTDNTFIVKSVTKTYLEIYNLVIVKKNYPFNLINRINPKIQSNIHEVKK